jgi:predicted transcriptional regulator of viral defense system
MMTNRHKPIEFSGTVAELAHTLAMPLDEITAAIGDLIAYGHLQRISNGVYRLVVKPTR